MKDARPANFVLLSDGHEFYVIERKKERKKKYYDLEHFEGFFPTIKAAYAHALQVTRRRIMTLEQIQSDLKSKLRRGEIYA